MVAQDLNTVFTPTAELLGLNNIFHRKQGVFNNFHIVSKIITIMLKKQITKSNKICKKSRQTCKYVNKIVNNSINKR